jgi:4-amino-4-deoxy-L-arabinose transferase-like glycosyltransferase
LSKTNRGKCHPKTAGPNVLQPVPASARQRGVIALLTLALLLPFLGKPFHLDDPLFLAVARQVRASPFDPFGFAFNWYGSAVSTMWTIMLNPPGLGYILAPLTALLGEHEARLHAVFLLFPLLAGQAAYDVARRFTDAPLAAALLFVSAPLFAVSATTLMADVPALALALAAVALLLAAIEGRAGAATLAGLAAAGAVLIKYNCVFLIPLFFLAAILFGERPHRHMVAFFLPLAALAGWNALSFHDHGVFHLLRATRIVRHERPDTPQMILAASAFLFLGVGSAPILLIQRLRRLDARIALLAALPAGAGLVILYRAANYRVAHWGPLSLLTLLTSAGGLAWIALAIRDGLSRTRKDLFLLLWLVGALVEAVGFSHFIAARFLLPALLPLVLLPLRHASPRSRAIGVGVAFLLSLVVGLADLDLARAYREAAATLHARYGALGPRLRFQGHWGFQYCMERNGHRALDDALTDLAPGDVIATPRWGPDVHYRLGPTLALDSMRFFPEDLIRLSGHAPVTVMNRDTGAGFYSMNWGPLPFSWGSSPLSRSRSSAYEPLRAPVPQPGSKTAPPSHGTPLTPPRVSGR